MSVPFRMATRRRPRRSRHPLVTTIITSAVLTSYVVQNESTPRQAARRACSATEHARHQRLLIDLRARSREQARRAEARSGSAHLGGAFEMYCCEVGAAALGTRANSSVLSPLAHHREDGLAGHVASARHASLYEIRRPRGADGPRGAEAFTSSRAARRQQFAGGA